MKLIRKFFSILFWVLGVLAIFGAPVLAITFILAAVILTTNINTWISSKIGINLNTTSFIGFSLAVLLCGGALTHKAILEKQKLVESPLNLEENLPEVSKAKVVNSNYEDVLASNNDQVDEKGCLIVGDRLLLILSNVLAKDGVQLTHAQVKAVKSNDYENLYFTAVELISDQDKRSDIAMFTSNTINDGGITIRNANDLAVRLTTYQLSKFLTPFIVDGKFELAQKPHGYDEAAHCLQAK